MLKSRFSLKRCEDCQSLAALPVGATPSISSDWSRPSPFDLVIDFGTINDTYRSLADRIQSQTGIPYLLIDGRFEYTPAALRLVADVLGVKDGARRLRGPPKRLSPR